MRIENITPGFVKNPPVQEVCRKQEEPLVRANKEDRVELSSTSAAGIEKKIADKIYKAVSSNVSEERLNDLRQRIKNGEYYVNSVDVARAMLK